MGLKARKADFFCSCAQSDQHLFYSIHGNIMDSLATSEISIFQLVSVA